MQGARISVHGERLRVDEPGVPKLVGRVNEVTFNGQVGLASGKRIFYVTDLALLELTKAGLTLRSVMPGIDIDRDLLANAEARIHVPGNPAPETVPVSVVTGKGFDLNWSSEVT
jgi:propionate CoA-transferase